MPPSYPVITIVDASTPAAVVVPDSVAIELAGEPVCSSGPCQTLAWAVVGSGTTCDRLRQGLSVAANSLSAIVNASAVRQASNACNVTVTATDASGASATAVRQLAVSLPPPPSFTIKDRSTRAVWYVGTNFTFELVNLTCAGGGCAGASYGIGGGTGCGQLQTLRVAPDFTSATVNGTVEAGNCAMFVQVTDAYGQQTNAPSGREFSVRAGPTERASTQARRARACVLLAQ